MGSMQSFHSTLHHEWAEPASDLLQRLVAPLLPLAPQFPQTCPLCTWYCPKPWRFQRIERFISCGFNKLKCADLASPLTSAVRNHYNHSSRSLCFELLPYVQTFCQVHFVSSNGGLQAVRRTCTTWCLVAWNQSHSHPLIKNNCIRHFLQLKMFNHSKSFKAIGC